MTKEPKWTKETWWFVDGTTPHVTSLSAPAGDICDLYHKRDDGKGLHIKDNAIAHGHLIAAAPELYGSLHNIMDGIETGMITVDSPADEQLAYALRQAKAALSKALGETE